MYKKNETTWMKHYDFIIIDVLCCIVSFILAYKLRIGGNIFSNDLYRSILFVLLLVDLAVIFFFEPFSGVLKRGYLKELRNVIIHVAEVMFLLIMYMFVIHEGSTLSRLIIGYFSIIYLISNYVLRASWKTMLFKIANKSIKQGTTSLLVLTESKLVNKVVKELSNNNYGNYNVIGLCILDKDMSDDSYAFKVVANRDNVLDYTCREWVDEVIFITKSINPYKELTDGFSEMGITQHIAINVADNLEANVNIIDKVGLYTCLTSTMRTATNTQIFLKRVMDIIGGLVGCFITLILMIIFKPIIQNKSPGPLIYSSERIGKNGKRFKFYKFRSMVLNADELKKDLQKDNFMSDGMMFKVKNDPRIIPGYGEFIRKTSLDEFPQFWNVLKGDMSLVGTRPPTPDEWEKYKYHHRVRLSAKPGITGMWQASGRSEITDFEEIVKLDSYYVRNWSLGLDIKLLAKTTLLVIKRKGSL